MELNNFEFLTLVILGLIMIGLKVYQLLRDKKLLKECEIKEKEKK